MFRSLVAPFRRGSDLRSYRLLGHARALRITIRVLATKIIVYSNKIEIIGEISVLEGSVRCSALSCYRDYLVRLGTLSFVHLYKYT